MSADFKRIRIRCKVTFSKAVITVIYVGKKGLTKFKKRVWIVLGCCKSREKLQKVRLNGIQLPITQLLPNRFQCNFPHRVRKSFSKYNIKANFLFERQSRRRKLLKKGWTFKVDCWPIFLNHSYQVHGKPNWAKRSSNRSSKESSTQSLQKSRFKSVWYKQSQAMLEVSRFKKCT